jgi:hypothetical protein
LIPCGCFLQDNTTTHATNDDALPSYLIWLPIDREQQGLATIADWLTKSISKHSSSTFTAARLQQLGLRVVGAEDCSPGARNYVWWPGVVRERALKMHSFRHGAEMLLAREDCRQVRLFCTCVPHVCRT